MNHRLQEAIASSDKTQEVKSTEEKSEVEEEKPDRGSHIETTQEEIDAYNIIKAIVCNVIEPNKISMRDCISYCSILVNDNRRNLCRLYFDRAQKYIIIVDDSKNEQRYDINEINDLYKYADHLRESVKRYI